MLVGKSGTHSITSRHPENLEHKQVELVGRLSGRVELRSSAVTSASLLRSEVSRNVTSSATPILLLRYVLCPVPLGNCIHSVYVKCSQL